MNRSGPIASSDKNDEQLMLEYASGDMQGFTLLYARYEHAVYRYAYNGCNNEANARELFQDVWLRVIRACKTFKPAQPFKAWLFSIARNLLIDHYRKNSTSALDQQSDNALDSNPDAVHTDTINADYIGSAHTALSPEQIASAAQENETLRVALQSLPFDQREAVMLKHIAGFSIDEIAQIQGQGAQTVKSRLRYAMGKLRQRVKELS